MDADARRFYSIDEEFLTCGRDRGTREELEHLVNYAIAAKSLSVYDLLLNQARIVYPSPGLRPPPPLRGGGQMQEKELRRNSRLSREFTHLLRPSSSSCAWVCGTCGSQLWWLGDSCASGQNAARCGGRWP